MVDPVVKYTVQQVKEFNEKKLKSTTKEGWILVSRMRLKT